jgi:hypothetical protein
MVLQLLKVTGTSISAFPFPAEFMVNPLSKVRNDVCGSISYIPTAIRFLFKFLYEATFRNASLSVIKPSFSNWVAKASGEVGELIRKAMFSEFVVVDIPDHRTKSFGNSTKNTISRRLAATVK